MRRSALSAIAFLVFGCSGAEGGPNVGTIGGPPSTAVSPGSSAGASGGDAGADPSTDAGPMFGGDDAGEIDAAPPPPKEPELVPADDLEIDEIAVYQGVKVRIAKDGARVDASGTVHVVAGREGVLRVFVSPKSGFVARELVGRLTLRSEGRDPVVIEVKKTIDGTSSEDDLDSTLNFDLDPAAVSPGVSYKVEILERASGAKPSGAGAVYPAGGALDAMDVWDTGEALKVVLVPVKSNGYVPDTSPEQIERYRSELHALYPARKVQITVRDTYAYTGSLGAGGSGIYSLLDAVTALRKKDGAPNDVYYYGVFTPTSSYSTYCKGGCTTGLCHVPGETSSHLRACVGVGFTGKSSAGTMAHELGHAHGRKHVACGGASGSDASYPYSSGAIGSWGYDVRTKSLVSPTKSKDFMSYCGPEWISDYTFDKLIHRMSAVAKQSFVIPGPAVTYRFVHVLPDGALEWGSEITLDEPMTGEPHAVTYETPSGPATVTGYFSEYGDGGGALLVPTTTTRFDAIEVSGFPSWVKPRLPVDLVK